MPPQTHANDSENSTQESESEKTATVRVYHGRNRRRRGPPSPDATHEVEIHAGRKFDAPVVELESDVYASGWYGFDVVDIPTGMVTAELNVHASDGVQTSPLEADAVKRGLVFDNQRSQDPGLEPPTFFLEGAVVVWLAPDRTGGGGR